MRYPLAEIIDRLSILRLKQSRLPQSRLPHDFTLNAQIDKLWNAAFEWGVDVVHIIKWKDALLAVNGKIWDLEADIRSGKEGILGLEEVGRRALAIREFNAERIQLKNEIASHVNEYLETKIDHASATPR